MVRKIFLLAIILIVFLLNNSTVYADDVIPGGLCKQGGGSVCCNTPTGPCVNDGSYECQPDPNGVAKYSDGSVALRCLPLPPVAKSFGKIQPPDALKAFIGNDPTGATGISRLLSNIIGLFYVVAAIVLIFMLIWGAYDWLTSEGDKEKLSSAQKKIFNAIIGILLFAVAFAVIQVLGTFTGFKFFVGQK